MRVPLYLILIFLFSLKITAQPDNLVVNPGFEQLQSGANYPICSYALSNQSFDNAASDWSTWNGMTPDLIIWKPDTYGDCRFPKPHSGDNMLGFITYLPGTDLGRLYDFHELVQGKLRFPLTPGQPYRVEFFIRQADLMAIDHLRTLYGEKQDVVPTAAGNLGICFLYNPMRWFSLDEVQPQVVFKDPIVTQQGEWLKLSATFVPDRSFLYFIIGNFSKDKNTPTTLENSSEIEQFNLATSGFAEKKKRVAYYLLDDLSVTPVEIKKPVPSISTSITSDLKKKKSYTFKNVNFETGKWDLLPDALPELDALAVFLKENPKVQVEIGGHTDNVGSDTDNQVLSENRAEAVRNYLVARGIAAERLAFKGYGESKPVASNETGEGRLANRRVECTID